MADWSFYDRGFSVFPLLPRTKHPAVKEWEPYQTARAAPGQIAPWAAQEWNMGIATGAVSGCIVLDCDSALARVAAEVRGIPATLTVATPRGTHFYFQHPGWQVRNRAGRTWTKDLDGEGLDGWDMRGDGGFVVGPGSFYQPTPAELAKGKLAGHYVVERDAPLAPAPDWLLALIYPKEAKPAAPARTAVETSNYGRAALNAEMLVLTSTTAGGVNNQVNLSAFAVGQLVAGGEVASEEGWGALLEAMAVLGVADEEKAVGTLERGWLAGMENPRAAETLDAAQILGTRGALAAGPIAPPPPTQEHHPLTQENQPFTDQNSAGEHHPQEPVKAILRGQTVWANQMPQLFANCYFVQSIDRIFVRGMGLLTPTSFDTVFGGFQYPTDVQGTKTTRSAWEAFRTSPGWKCPIVFDTCFRPELEPGTIVDIEGLPFLNTYEPIITPRRAGDPEPFLRHVRALLPNGQDADLLLHWMASAVQNVGRKFFWWPVVQGTKGNGKSLLLRVMTHAIGERYTHLVRADSVIKTGNQFNDWIVGKLFLGFEEIRSSEGRRDFVEMMKDTVTDMRTSVEAKGRGQRTADNRANGMMLSNWKDACPVDDDERRWGIFFTAQQCAEDLERDGMTGRYFPDLYVWLRSGGYEVVTNYLATMPLRAELDPAQDLHRAPFTSSTQEAITESLGLVEQEIVDAVEADAVGFRGGVATSIALRGLLDRLRKTIAPKRYRSVMASVGFVTHPALGVCRGRPNNRLSDGTRPVLYFRKDHEILKLSEPSEIARLAELALSGNSVNLPENNVVAFRPPIPR